MATRLIKQGIAFNLKILGEDELSIVDTFKTKIFKTLGNFDYYQFIGKGDQQVSFKIFIASLDEYDSLISFFSDGLPFALEIDDFRLPFRLTGDIKASKSYQDGSYIVELNFTSAQDPDAFDTGVGIVDILESTFRKPTALDTLKKWASSTISFVGNTNSSISAFTGKYEQYSVAITQLANGIASSSSIITSPISSIKNSTSSIIGGVAGVVSSIGTAINAIQQVPTDIDNMIDSILDIGDQLSNIFNFDDKDAQVKTTSNFLIDVANDLIEVDGIPLSGKTIILDPYSVEFDAEIVITALDNRNNEVLSVLILTSILLALYEESAQVTRWSKKDLDNLLKQTEILFEYITKKDINSDVRTQLVLARNSFFATFRPLYENALNIVDVFVNEPKFLTDVVYSVNGNFDYYDNTKKLNNIIGSVVQGNIQIISNA